MSILITGGAGFIGSNFVLDWLVQSDESIVNVDKLTYAGNPENLANLQGDPRHHFVQGDLGDRTLVGGLLAQHRPRAVLHFAAESHVDRSIHGPEDFIQTNIVGTFRLLEAVRAYWSVLPEPDKTAFRFLQSPRAWMWALCRTTTANRPRAYCGVCITKFSMRRASWYGWCRARCLMWRWICAAHRPPLGSGWVCT